MSGKKLEEYRQQLGLPAAGSDNDRATVAKLEIGGSVFFGISSGSNPNRRKITLKVNPISRTHAEADAFQQAFELCLSQNFQLKIGLEIRTGVVSSKPIVGER